MADTCVCFLKVLNMYKGKMTKQELKTLRGQALAGNVEEAKKGLKRLLKERDGLSTNISR